MDLDEFERFFRYQSRFGPHTIRSPIRYEVWREFALRPSDRVDLLLEATPQASCVGVATAVLTELEATDTTAAKPAVADDVVLVSVRFTEFLRALVPLTSWAGHVHTAVDLGPRGIAAHLRAVLGGVLTEQDAATIADAPDTTTGPDELGLDRVEVLRWFLLLSARIGSEIRYKRPPAEFDRQIPTLARWLHEIFSRAGQSTELPVASISVNRPAHSSVNRSRSTIKADAAARLFEIDASAIGWAVVDSGIDARHLAFRKRDPATRLPYPVAFERLPAQWANNTRVERTYDLLQARQQLTVTSVEALRKLEIGAQIEKECRVPHNDSYRPPVDLHGTHVAGILGSDWTHQPVPSERTNAALALPSVAWDPNPDPVVGVCPTVTMWDFRVLDDVGRGDEFAILTALNHIKRINDDAGRLLIKGVNLSLSLAHDVANYACGWTPICQACDRLVDSGVVVVVAAGNTGFRAGAGRRLADGTNYLPISITDPGNADKVITVGATHRELPYRYGVSYFSSRGPTADGRRKPDVLAPGEGIVGPVGENDRKTLDGTSQAAPHVSGAAALLLARYPELVGQPGRVKQILCDSASDLQRDATFQGHGLVDILRALQSI